MRGKGIDDISVGGSGKAFSFGNASYAPGTIRCLLTVRLEVGESKAVVSASPNVILGSRRGVARPLVGVGEATDTAVGPSVVTARPRDVVSRLFCLLAKRAETGEGALKVNVVADQSSMGCSDPVAAASEEVLAFLRREKFSLLLEVEVVAAGFVLATLRNLIVLTSLRNLSIAAEGT